MLPLGILSEADFNIKSSEVTSVIKYNQNTQNITQYFNTHIMAYPSIKNSLS